MLKRRRNARCTAVTDSVLMNSRTQKILCCIVAILLSTDAAVRQASALAVVFENLGPPLSNVMQFIHIPCIVHEIQAYEIESIFLNHAVFLLSTAACISLDYSPNTVFRPDETVPFLAMPCFRRVNFGQSPRTSGFDHRPVFVLYVVDGVRMRTGFLRVYLICFPVNPQEPNVVYIWSTYS